MQSEKQDDICLPFGYFETTAVVAEYSTSPRRILEGKTEN
jgi:hypothetical protein